MNKPRVGVIGGGVFGSNILRAFSYAHKKGVIELAALADLSDKVLNNHMTAYGINGYKDYNEMFGKENLDAVAVVTPDYLHKQVVIDAARRGIHILCQKPLDTSSDGGYEMIKTARENNALLCVDFHKRFDPGHITLKQDIRNGKLGKILYGYACMEDKIVVPFVWFKNWAHNSSPVWFLGIHFYDLIYWLIESRPVRCYATGSKYKLKSMGIDTYDSIQAKIEFENGESFTVDASWILPESFTSIVNQNIKIVGSEGIVEVDSENRGILSAFESAGGSVTGNPYSSMLADHKVYGVKPSGYVYESMLHFTELVSLLKNGRTLGDIEGLYCSGEEAIVSTKMAEAVHKSLRTGNAEDIKW